MRRRTIGFVLVAIGLVGLVGTSAVFVGTLMGGASVMPMWGPFGGPRCDAPKLPGHTVEVTLSERGMMGGRHMMNVTVDPSAVPAGQVSLVARNAGMMVHELVVLPLPHDRAGSRSVDANGEVNETDSLGEASRTCGEGSGDGVAQGSLGWVTLHLAPGHYELICNEPGHYAMGMFAELDVRA